MPITGPIQSTVHAPTQLSWLSIANIAQDGVESPTYIHTYIRKEYLYSAKNQQSLGAEISSHQCKQMGLKSSFEMVKHQVRSLERRW